MFRLFLVCLLTIASCLASTAAASTCTNLEDGAPQISLELSTYGGPSDWISMIDRIRKALNEKDADLVQDFFAIYPLYRSLLTQTNLFKNCSAAMSKMLLEESKKRGAFEVTLVHALEALELKTVGSPVKLPLSKESRIFACRSPLRVNLPVRHLSSPHGQTHNLSSLPLHVSDEKSAEIRTIVPPPAALYAMPRPPNIEAKKRGRAQRSLRQTLACRTQSSMLTPTPTPVPSPSIPGEVIAE